MKKLLSILIVAVLSMASSTVDNARLVSSLTVYETLATPTSTFDVTNDDLNETVNFRDGLTRHDVDHVWGDTVINAGTIDLTGLTNAIGESLDLTGETIMAIKFVLEDDAAATMTISQGAANPYPLMGATYSFTLKANQSLLFYCDSVNDVVAAGAKDIAYTGSNDSTILSVLLITADGYE